MDSILRVKLKEYDDWIEVYINEVIVFQNHSIKPVELLELIGNAFNNATFQGIKIKTIAGEVEYCG